MQDETLPGERWRAIPGYEGLYEASSEGRIRSLDREVRTGIDARRVIKGRILSQVPGAYGYLLVGLYLRGGGKRRTYAVHSLVVATFHGPRPSEDHECCHWDNDRTNNRASNLRWGTRSENRDDQRRHGTFPESNKTHCPYGHEYTEENTYWHGIGKRKRKCLTCQKAYRKWWQLRRNGIDVPPFADWLTKLPGHATPQTLP